MSYIPDHTKIQLESTEQLTIGEIIDFIQNAINKGDINRSTKVVHSEYGGVEKTKNINICDNSTICISGDN
jgi:hypothetical protein